jgi:hypothetical protein
MYESISRETLDRSEGFALPESRRSSFGQIALPDQVGREIGQRPGESFLPAGYSPAAYQIPPELDRSIDIALLVFDFRQIHQGLALPIDILERSPDVECLREASSSLRPAELLDALGAANQLTPAVRERFLRA